MDLFGLLIAIFYFFIISKSYRWICKVTRKEQFIFLCYTLISVLLLEEFINLLNLGGFGISKFLFPLLVSIYQIELIKEYLSVYYYLYYIIALILFYQ